MQHGHSTLQQLDDTIQPMQTDAWQYSMHSRGCCKHGQAKETHLLVRNSRIIRTDNMAFSS